MATPLPRKLGIQPGMRVAFVDAEPALNAHLVPWPPGALRVDVPTAPMHVIVLFASELATIEAQFDRLAASLEPAGGLWIAWPKKASKRPTDLSFAVVQDVGLTAGWVDNKKCAIDAVWSGLRFVRRLADRPEHTTKKRS